MNTNFRRNTQCIRRVRFVIVFESRFLSLSVIWQASPETLSFINLLINSVVCLTTGPQPLPKPVLHTVRYGAPSSNFQYSLLSFRSSSSCLRLFPHLPVISISVCLFLSFFHSIMCFIRQFLRKMLPIQLLLLFLLCVGHYSPP